MFRDAVEDVSMIEYGEINDQDCPCMRNVLDDLLNGDPNNYLCSMVQGIFNHNTFKLDFEINNSTSPSTTNSGGHNGYNSTIYVPECFCFDNPPNNCGKSDVQIATEFIHELIHARFHQISFDYIGTSTEWTDAIRDHFNLPVGEPIIANHHYLFYDLLIKDIANALRNLHGGNGPIENYYYQAHVMINTQQLSDALNGTALDENGNPIPIPSWKDELTQDQLNELLNFDLQTYKDAWDSIGGDDTFTIRC